MKEIEYFGKPIMVLNMNRKIDFFRNINLFIIFSKEVIVFAHIDKKKKIELFNNWSICNKQCDDVFTEVDFKKYLIKYGDRYYDILIDKVLKESNNNFLLENIDVEFIRFKAQKRLNSFIDEEVGKLVIKTAKRKFKFTHQYRDWNRKIYENLLQLYDSKLEYIEGDMELSVVFKKGRNKFH